MSVKAIIDGVLEREGGGRVTNDSADHGGRTQYGISERSHAAAWADGKVTEAEARDIYESKYYKGPGYDQIPDSHAKTREQLVDFAVNSGPYIATQKLQEAVGTKVDGKFGKETLAKLLAIDDRSIANLLAVARIRMLGRIVQKNNTQARWISGWLNRATEWIH